MPQNALDVLKSGQHSYARTEGIVVVGEDDETYGDEGREVYTAMRSAGIKVELQVVPGTHTWDAWQPALTANLPWLAYRLGLLSSPAPAAERP
ncbi:hypothetical protein [Humibacillus xanthopallidus]|uniref:hypothetical protein n=1 Tax=Humibacillus xanthopallidus TaxID=412689 RepID=UPI0038509854